MPLLASDFCADHGTVVAQDAVVCSAASSGSVLATQVQYGTGSQRDARPEANFDQHCCADLAPAKSSSLASFCSIPITDGGGRISTACWVHPQEPVDRLKYLRGKFLHWMRSWGVVPRLLRHISEGSEQHLFSESEQGQLQGSLAQALDTLGFPCSCEIPIHQPFLLDIWRALTRATFDMDKDLPKLLTEGVPTGILSSIPASGVWDAVEDCDTELENELFVHLVPWKSAADNVELARELFMKDVSAGFAYILPGGAAEAVQKWGSNVAAGRLGVVQAPGRKPRLIGDGSISGANRACIIPEKARLPGLSSVQRFLSESGSGSAWVALSFDVASAHKLIRVKPEEQGLGCFALGNDFFVYRSCYFGAKYSAYWWSRVGAWLVRMLHRFLWISHACFLYVDDGLVLVPKDVAPLLASACLAFLTALGVPLSWKKVKLGDELIWIGWRFCFSSGYIQLTDDKSQKILEALSPFCTIGQKVDRKAVERLIGLLLWYSGGAVHLRPWLQALYHLLYKPRCVFRSVTPHQFEVLRQLMDTKLALTGHMECCDLQQGWVLYAVANCAVSSLGADALVSPRLKRGQVDCVFYNYSSVSVRTNLASMWACKLFYNAVAKHQSIPLRRIEESFIPCAADAFATTSVAGVGGWWAPTAESARQDQVFWFSISLGKWNLPEWLICEKLQSYIASFEALGQLLLLLGRVRGIKSPAHHVLLMRQLCDNAAVAASTQKMLSLKAPLAFVLQAISYHAVAHGVQLTSAHCAGERNGWADDLSREKVSGFNPLLRVEFDLMEILAEPWASLGHS